MRYGTILNRISDIILHNGYANQLATEHLSGYEIIKYYIERSEKYKLGLCPSGSPLLSYSIPRMVFDGIAYQQYMEWHSYEEKNYYYFRYHYASILDLSYLFMMSDNQELGDVDLLIVSSLFQKIESIVREELEDDYYLENDEGHIEDKELKYLFERLHFLGRSIYVSWINDNSPRFRFAKKLINDQFNPFGI